jgi:probable biosynthetic protein (TIGR04098 family)
VKIKLGMPHLSYNGLDPIWLAKTLGDSHWGLLKDIHPFNQGNQRLYASFFAAEFDFNQGQHLYCENNILDINSKIFKFNNMIYRSMHTFGIDQNLGNATLDSIFVKKDIETGKLVKDEPAALIKNINTVDHTFLEEHSRLKKQLIAASNTMDLTDFNELPLSPDTHFNGVKILYFANYIQLALLNEFLTFKKIADPISRLRVYWFSNISWKDQVFALTVRTDNEYKTILTANNKPIAVIVNNRTPF